MKMGSKQGRSTSLYALPCLCLLLGLLILVFQAGPLSLMWTHHLQNLAASPLVSTLPFSISNYTRRPEDGAWRAAYPPSQPLLEIEAGPCTCSLRTIDLFNPNLVFPPNMINCTCPANNATGSSFDMESRFIESTNPSFGNASSESSLMDGTGPHECANNTEPKTVIIKESCPPPKQVIQVKDPWYVKGRSWHPPPRFPRCTMDACFNYTKCYNSEELLIYTYNQPAVPAKFFKGINESKHNTNDPNKACLFFVFMDTPGPYRSTLHPSKLPYWEGGLNHVLITFGDKWLNKGPIPESIGYASAMATVMHESLYRPGFDVSIPLPAKRHFAKVRATKPFDRKYLMTFRGLRYLRNDGVLRSDAEFRGMHNGRDIIVVTSCRHPNHKDLRQKNATLDKECRNDEALHDKYDFTDLMNATFGLAPAGRQPSSYRFAEILSAGTVPVLIADNYVKPFDTLVQWQRCILQFPSTQIHLIEKSVRAMKREEVERRQKYCLQVYSRWFAGDEALMQASIEAQKVRFNGVFTAWPGMSYLD
eukprot:c36666_g1_i1 orf=61-1662(+)